MDKEEKSNLGGRTTRIKKTIQWLTSENFSRQIQNEGRNKTIQWLTKHSVDGIHGDLVLGRISNETLCVGERDIRRSSPVTLVVSDDLDAVVLPNPHARVRRPEIYSDRRPFALASHLRDRKHERAASRREMRNKKC